MNVGRRIVPECGNVILLEHAQQHAQQRSLTPWPAGVQLELTLADADWRLESRAEGGHVRACEPSSIRGMVIANGCGDVALVESCMSGSQASRTALRGCRLFLIDHVLQRAGEIGLAEDLTRTRRTAARQEHLCISGKGPVFGGVGDKGDAKARIGVTAAREQLKSGALER